MERVQVWLKHVHRLHHILLYLGALIALYLGGLISLHLVCLMCFDIPLALQRVQCACWATISFQRLLHMAGLLSEHVQVWCMCLLILCIEQPFRLPFHLL